GLAVADPTGQVPAGSLGKDLLADDSSQPFGVRLDPAKVMAAFTEAWAEAEPDPSAEDAGGVVVVEASDLARTLRYRPIVDFERYRAMWLEALEHTDELVASLLDEVDPERDTVLVVAPYNKRGDRDLTVVGLRGPDVEPGYLRSASTQRAGFLTLVDVGPTILDAFGVDRPIEMEGRPAVVSATDD
ncbi:MAG: hypothetical protein KDB15_17370, partial [Microthrixaceae bacterium]|nr:hypothetical protein [Microthrixaceae bacterium]